MSARQSLIHFRLLSVVWMLVAIQVTHGFVLNKDDSGRVRQWMISEMEPTVTTNIFNPTTKAIRYFLGSDGYSTTNRAAELNAIRACFHQWQSVPGTSLKFEDGGLIASGADINTSDQTNVIYWANESTLVNGGRDNIFGTLAVTFPHLTNNILIEADMVLNGVQFAWFTDFSATNSTEQLIEASVLHEIGHFIGLDHSPVGGATMFARGTTGIGTQAGLSGDEMAAIRALYPAPKQTGAFGHLRGQVVMAGIGVFGASVLIEDSAGNLACGTMTQSNGFYELPQLAPGNYQVRVSPLDPPSNNSLTRLITGGDISPAFAGAETGFLPTTNVLVSISSGRTNLLNFSVSPGIDFLRITRIVQPGTSAEDLSAINAPVTLRQGQSNVIVGVYSPSFRSEAILRITGDGFAAGPSTFIRDAFPGSNPSLNLLHLRISVGANATPGLRSFVVQHGTNLAYANGFLEILPRFLDDNFDGLNDIFQRRYFPLFTAPEAGPFADPDGDGFDNAHEYLAGSDPNDARSLLRIERVELTLEGSILSWQSEPGKHYQVFSGSRFGTNVWQAVGNPVTATGKVTTYLPIPERTPARFYQVQVLP